MLKTLQLGYLHNTKLAKILNLQVYGSVKLINYNNELIKY